VSHAPASGLIPADLAGEACRKGLQSDGLSVPSLVGGRYKLASPWTSFGLRVGLLGGTRSSPGGTVPHLEKAGGLTEGGGSSRRGGALTWGR
jgi:hypothetical protein